MPHVRIVNAPDRRPEDSVLGGWTTRFEIDGEEQRDVQNARLEFPADGPVTLHLEQLVTKPFEFDGRADVHLHVHLPEGCKLMETTNHSSPGKEYTVVKVVAAMLLLLALALPAAAQDVWRIYGTTVEKPAHSTPPPAPEEALRIWQAGHPEPDLTRLPISMFDYPIFETEYHDATYGTLDRLSPGYQGSADQPLWPWQPQDRCRGLHLQPTAWKAVAVRPGHPSGFDRSRLSGVRSTGSVPTGNLPRLDPGVREDLLRPAPSHGAGTRLQHVGGEPGLGRPAAAGGLQAPPHSRQR